MSRRNFSVRPNNQGRNQHFNQTCKSNSNHGSQKHQISSHSKNTGHNVGMNSIHNQNINRKDHINHYGQHTGFHINNNYHGNNDSGHFASNKYTRMKDSDNFGSTQRIKTDNSDKPYKTQYSKKSYDSDKPHKSQYSKKSYDSDKPHKSQYSKKSYDSDKPYKTQYLSKSYDSDKPYKDQSPKQTNDSNKFDKTTYPKKTNDSNKFDKTTYPKKTNDSNKFDKTTYPKQTNDSNKFDKTTYPKKTNDSNNFYKTTYPKKSYNSGHFDSKPSNYHNSDKCDKRLQSIANDTLDIIKHGEYKYGTKPVNIKQDISNCVSRTQTIRPSHYDKNWKPKKSPGERMCRFAVLPESAFGAARKFVQQDKKRTCVLNFASATKPGGGFLNGKQAQEESLSRQSALYASLKTQDEMYRAHKADPNNELYTDYMIYSPDVPVFRDDKDEDRLLPESFKASVITSAAPNKAKNSGKMDLKAVIEDRCRKIVQCAIDKGNEVLVLGAYGCGVFGNNPREVSQAFKKVLVDENYGKYFDEVVFAIPGKTSRNFQIFNSEFNH
ncbi:hypothetical protein M9Y10_033504 [Tritrichomonas musculus]|uniref:Microbial-type PARG catalytic domain-containing protein n=1 Tax=Tritrichomonas musculus TaxID=1915356 RepID=A0ABR2KCC2_9EUKA